MTRTDLVIFDCDGVLIDSEVISARMLVAELAGYGVKIDLDYVARHFLGRSYPVVLAQIRGEFGVGLPDGFEADYRARLIRAFAADLRIIPGVREVIARRSGDVSRLVDATQAGGAVLDGRDIGTVIAPEAQAKLFVTASVEARAQRRFLEMRERGAGVNLLEIQDDLRRRDERDRNRAVAPLVPADDARVIDTSALDREEAIAAAIEAVDLAMR